ncbi:DUF2231 domain-containing protein [Pseudonocardia asaccharolytica]|uniref:DUF2231 domain-containing protein n=1 Tax=Pseudonocardia asaccharolytica DSM 44247 = NBRC 16224 TaxID=1123024 RepID=A0A511CZ45_9PSEU|nr:DUF2231 domain-containing protein [Pseudonocardia asaccharolytica]GEL17820.1 hypothetical protein PA7_16570 [Pseudonocardia asaccharolytica DSM 44247 = NBRC 16224]
MTSELQQQAKEPVSAAMAGPYGHPLHPMLVTVPIGAWVASLVFDVASYLVGDPAFLVKGSLWLIAVGVLGALAAALVGFLDLFAVPTGTPAHRTALVHMALVLAVTAGYVVGFLWRRGTVEAAGPVGLGPLLLSVGCLLALAVAGFLGGKLAFRYGVRVADEATQAEGYRRPAEPTAPAQDRSTVSP